MKDLVRINLVSVFYFCAHSNGSFLIQQKLRLRIEDPPRRKHMVYLGGAVLAGIMKVIFNLQPLTSLHSCL